MAYRNVIQKTHDITREMLQFSKANDWEKVISCEQERQALLSQLTNIKPEEPDQVSENLLQEIIEMNVEIEALSRKEMESCQQEYAAVKNQKNAISAYSSF